MISIVRNVIIDIIVVITIIIIIITIITIIVIGIIIIMFILQGRVQLAYGGFLFMCVAASSKP